MKKDIERLSISIVVPVYKSASTLQELHTRLGEVASKENLEIEIIYVNDASPDDSLKILLGLPALPAHSVYSLKKNQGQSPALLTGILHARYDLLATLDADLQDDPDVLPLLIRSLQRHKDVIFAARSGQYETPSRLFTSLLFKSVVTLFSRGRIPLNAGLFLAGRKEKLLPLSHYLPDRPYLIGLIAKAGLKCHSLKIIRQENRYGQTSYTLLKRIKVAQSFFYTLLKSKAASDQKLLQWVADHIICEKTSSRKT